MNHKTVSVTRFYGTHFKLDGEKLNPPDNFMARYKDRPIMCASYYVNEGGGHGTSNMECKEYKFIDLATMETLSDVSEIEIPVQP